MHYALFDMACELEQRTMDKSKRQSCLSGIGSDAQSVVKDPVQKNSLQNVQSTTENNQPTRVSKQGFINFPFKLRIYQLKSGRSSNRTEELTEMLEITMGIRMTSQMRDTKYDLLMGHRKTP